MNIFGLNIERAKEQRATITQNATPEQLVAFFGMDGRLLPSVSTDAALKVPAVWAAVTFLSRTLAALPLHVYSTAGNDGAQKVSGGINALLHDAPHPEWTSFKWRQYTWQQVFTCGRSLTYIDRNANGSPRALYPLDPVGVKIENDGDRTTYKVKGKPAYNAADIIDVAFMLRPDRISSYGPVTQGSETIQLALAMNSYGSNFFAGGGVPPLVVKGPMPKNDADMRRAGEDIRRAIKAATDNGSQIVNLPSGFELVPIGFDPQKGQMTEARRFQIEEIARLFNLPPVFLQDLTHGTFSNTEQQDLHLVKHLVGQWATAFEQELNLKLFPATAQKRYAKHNVDGLLRGDFATRMSGLATAVQNGIMTPNEGRALENRPPKPNGDDLMIQGATVPIGTQPTQPEEAD